MSRLGMAGRGKAVEVWPGKSGRGRIGSGGVRLGMAVKARCGAVRWGMAG